jgi:hypothetical protein
MRRRLARLHRASGLPNGVAAIIQPSVDAVPLRRTRRLLLCEVPALRIVAGREPAELPRYPFCGGTMRYRMLATATTDGGVGQDMRYGEAR